MEKQHVILCVEFNGTKYRLNAVVTVPPAEGMTYRFRVGESNEFYLIVDGIECDIDDRKRIANEAHMGIVWVGLEQPIDIPLSHHGLLDAGFEESHL